MCWLHKQNINGLLKIGLPLEKAENQGHFRPLFLSVRFQTNILPYRYHFKCVLMIPNLNSYVVNEKYQACLALIGLSKATYHCLSSAVRGIPK